MRIADGLARRVERDRLAQRLLVHAQPRDARAQHPAALHVALFDRIVAIDHPRHVDPLAVGRDLHVSGVDAAILVEKKHLAPRVSTTAIGSIAVAIHRQASTVGRESHVTRPAADGNFRDDLVRFQVDDRDFGGHAQGDVCRATVGRNRNANRLETKRDFRHGFERRAAPAKSFERAAVAATDQ